MDHQTIVMGVLNVTPDSFSDGGAWVDPAAAIAHGVALAGQGATVIDVGGESTRPGALRPEVDVELARVLPVVSGLAEAGVKVSIDTMRPEVAAAAIAAGATIVNDVSGGKADAAMLPLISRTGVDYVLMHWRGHSADMQSRSTYGDTVGEVRSELLAQVEVALAAGVAPTQIIIDVGIGFAKSSEANWQLLRAVDEFNALGFRQLVGASRKRFLGELTGREPGDRDAASAAISAWCAQHGVWGVRVHTVPEHLDAVRVGHRLRESVRRTPRR